MSFTFFQLLDKLVLLDNSPDEVTIHDVVVEEVFLVEFRPVNWVPGVHYLLVRHIVVEKDVRAVGVPAVDIEQLGRIPDRWFPEIPIFADEQTTVAPLSESIEVNVNFVVALQDGHSLGFLEVTEVKSRLEGFPFFR